MAASAPSPTQDGRRPDGTRRQRATIRRRLLIAVSLLTVVAVTTGVIVALNRARFDVGRAVDRTIEAGTASIVATATVQDLPLLGDATLMVAQGAIDFDGQRARMTREIPLLAGRRLFGGPPVEAVELVYTPGGAWVKAPLGTARPWVRLADATGRADGPDLSAPGVGNPVLLLGVLRSLAGTPEEVGTDEVRGVESTRYRVVVDLDELVQLLPGSAVGWVRDVRRLRGSKNLPLDVWVGDDGRIRRIGFSLPVEVAGLRPLVVQTRVELFDFGAPVDIREPPPDQVADVSPEDLSRLDPLRQLRDFIDRFRP